MSFGYLQYWYSYIVLGAIFVACAIPIKLIYEEIKRARRKVHRKD